MKYSPAARNKGKQRRRIPKELVLRIFWFCGFHRPRFEPLITEVRHLREIRSAGPLVKSKCGESAPLSARDVRRLCELQIGKRSLRTKFPQKSFLAYYIHHSHLKRLYRTLAPLHFVEVYI